MARAAWILVGLIAAAGFAGCSEGAGDEDAPDVQADAAAQDDGPDGMDVAGVDGASSLATKVEPFEWDGSVGTVAYACGPAGCAGQGLPMGWEQSMELDGLVALDVEFTFEGLPGQELAFGLATKCDGPCDFVTYGVGAGSVPLSADGLDPGHTYTLVAWHPYHGAAVGGAQAGPQTAFRVVGELTTVVA